MKRVLTALVLIAVVLLILLLGPAWLTAASAALVAALAFYEFRSLAGQAAMPNHLPPLRAGLPLWWMIGATTVTFLFALTLPEYVLPVLALLVLMLFTWAGLRLQPERVLPSTAYGAFGLIYIVYAMAATVLIRIHEDGQGLLFFLLVCVWSGDIAALYIGRRFGRHKLAPTLSPNKTIEGSIASVAGSVFFGMALYFGGEALTQHGFSTLQIAWPAWQMLLLAVLLNIVAQLGDLLESAIKRGAGAKDSGTLLPGHGGILDRIDALLLAAPVMWFVLLAHDWLTLVR